MAKTRKWEIQGLDTGLALSDSAKTVLTNRLNNLLFTIGLFFENDSVENLHDVRIALRRVRYSMEIFFNCFDEKLFLNFYRRIEKLQDLSGLVRDLDVLKENIASLTSAEEVKVSKKVLKKFDQRRGEINETLHIELRKFIASKALRSFSEKLI